VIRHAVEAGLLDHWTKLTWERMKRESKMPLHNLSQKGLRLPLSLDDLQGAFYLCSLLLGMSIFTLIVEIFGRSKVIAKKQVGAPTVPSTFFAGSGEWK
jgi:hypothetical protein